MIEFRRRLRAEWWNAVAAVLAFIFCIRALSVLVTLALPVHASFFYVCLAVATLVAGVAVLGIFSADYIKQAGALRPWRARLAYAALAAGALTVLAVLISWPARSAAYDAFINDAACGADLDSKDTATPLCTLGKATVVRAWFGPSGQPYMYAERNGGSETAELECPGAGLVLMTARTVKTIRADVYQGRIARVAAGGLVCDTTAAPSWGRAFNETLFAIFGAGAAVFAWWILWGSARRARQLARQRPVVNSNTL